MVPPFIAYYGMITQNMTMLNEAYNQIKLYRNYLHDTNKTANNLWKHIVLGNDTLDPGHWSTGNGWVAAGMLRVLGTIKYSQYANRMKNQQTDLTNWIKEVQDGMYHFVVRVVGLPRSDLANMTYCQRDDGLFYNYADDNSTFIDASSAALMASTVYRMSLITNTHTHLPNAEKSRKALSSPSSNSTASNSSSLENMAHFTSDGWLTPVVNPDSFGDEGEHSPEGQAFVVEMHAAWRDWVENGSVGANGSNKSAEAPSKIQLGILGVFISSIITGLFGTSDDSS